MAKQTAKTFVPTKLGITAFLTNSGIDFVLEGPNKPQTRPVFVQVSKRKRELQLDGKAISISGYRLDEQGQPAKLDILWGKEELVLGRRTQAAGNASFYRSLEPQNSTRGPQTPEEIIAHLNALMAK